MVLYGNWTFVGTLPHIMLAYSKIVNKSLISKDFLESIFIKIL